jgi:alkylation response protein AidB-like acyl-CoA dehydrogenase/putative sterol carrier protein
MAGAHILAEGSDFLKEKYLPKSIAGEWVGALAITEPNAGSDVANICTTAVLEGDEYIVNGSKTFITNGVLSDYIVAAVKTETRQGAGGISLLIIDRNTQGVSARKLNKLGWHASDTGEISFDNVRVPIENLLGQENRGFFYIMDKFQLERLVMALSGVAMSEFALETALQYMNEREAFGRKINKFQVLRHRIADLASEITALKYFVYHICRMHNDGQYAVKEASMAKLLATELADKVMYQCLQFFGGYGFMEDYPLARMFRDSRIGTIGGGSSEIMREIISKMVIDNVQYDKPQVPVENTSVWTAKEIILSLSHRLKPHKAAEFNGTFHFDIAGENGGQFTVTIESGKCLVGEGLSGEAKCLVETTDKIYEAVESGKLNPQEAFITGKIKASNPLELMSFGGFFSRIEH